MTPTRWLVLLAFYITYLLFGASIYYHIENSLEREHRAQALQERIEINEYLLNHLSHKDKEIQNEILVKITDYCDKPVTNYTLDEFEDPYKWTFYHSLFFAFTVCSTVGYGNLAPSTTLGQMIMMIYSLIGMPINGILFAGLGEFFSQTFIKIHQRYKKYKMSNDDKYVPRQLGLYATLVIALIPGITFFIILPSLIFSYFEGWPYTLSIYFSYVTTTTIGFGDYVPTFQPHQEREFGSLFVLYQVFIICWFIFALGYVMMIMSFITKGLRSKKLSELEQQLSLNIKATQSRIWNGVTKDVGYLRRILTELYIMKFKPVYREPGENFQLPRSASCPDLSMYRVVSPIVSRKRAFSENYGGQNAQEQLALGTPLYSTIPRVSSDTDLEKINKEKTFETAQAFMETTDLLAKVVTALANIKPSVDDVKSITSTTTRDGLLTGYHGFSDSEILASEGDWSFPTVENPIFPRYQRARASSDFYISPRTIPPQNNEWTWGADNQQIQQVINKRVKTAKKKEDLYKASFQIPPLATILNIDENDPKNDRKGSSDSRSILKRFIPFRKKSTISVPEINSNAYEKPPLADNYSTVTVGQPLSDSDFSKTNNILSSSRKRSNIFEASNQSPNLIPVLGKERKGGQFTNSDINRTERRNSMFPTGSRRKSGISMDRRASLFTGMTRRESLLSGFDRRNSLFSVPSQEEIDQEVLENTTIADLIRALELMHTHATLQDPTGMSQQPKRKLGTASLSPPKLPPLFTLFSQDNEQQIQRNFSRRSTIFSTISNPTSQQAITGRRSSIHPSVDPPPYTEKESPKFKRRFSVRPTNLQIPPGKAPPVNSSKSQANLPQTALQRRLSLRPSPLARDTSTELSSARSIFSRQVPGQSSIGRGNTSTHSPLSRIAQIQASRKGSMEIGQTDMNKKQCNEK